MSGPFVKDSRCWCCAEVEPEGTHTDGCVGQTAPRYLSLRLSTGTDLFPSDTPIDWGTGAKPAGASWVYTWVMPWLRKHVAGEGPDIVLQSRNFPDTSSGGVGEWDGRIASSAQIAGTFTGDPTNNPNAGSDRYYDLVPTSQYYSAITFYFRYDYLTDKSILRIRFANTEPSSSSSQCFFESTIDRPRCDRLAPVPGLKYIKFENEHDADPDGTYSDTSFDAINNRAGGGTAYIRPGAVLNKLPQGDPQLGIKISKLTGDFIPRHKKSWSLGVNLDWCHGGAETVITADGTFDVENPNGTYSQKNSHIHLVKSFEKTNTFRRDPDDSSNYGCQYPVAGSSDLTNDIRILTYGVGFSLVPIGFAFGRWTSSNPTFYPWADSNFDPQTDSLADGATVDLWAIDDDSGLLEVVGTATIPSLHAIGADVLEGPYYGGDPIKCYEYTDAAGFDFTHFQSQEGDYYCRSISGVDTVNADTFDEWSAKMVRLMPWGTTFSKVDAATAPLLESIKVHDWRGSSNYPYPIIKNTVTGPAFREELTPTTC